MRLEELNKPLEDWIIHKIEELRDEGYNVKNYEIHASSDVINIMRNEIPWKLLLYNEYIDVYPISIVLDNSHGDQYIDIQSNILLVYDNIINNPTFYNV